jgi:23S rRNA (cytidine1920-2'-O)/16S rRNA (cytidine1409-2'-O)-methyltransferase
VDVSFISVLKILPALRPLLVPEADLVVLVKPQFEVGRFHVGRGGIVKDPALHAQALRDVAWAAQHEQGYAVVAACASPITGTEGNREFFLHMRRDGAALPPETLEAMIPSAVQE